MTNKTPKTDPTPTNKTIDDLIDRYEAICATHAQRFNRGETDSVQLQNDLDHAQEDFKQALLTYIKEEQLALLDKITEKACDDMHGTFDYDIIAEGVFEEVNKLKERNRLEQS